MLGDCISYREPIGLNPEKSSSGAENCSTTIFSWRYYFALTHNFQESRAVNGIFRFG